MYLKNNKLFTSKLKWSLYTHYIIDLYLGRDLILSHTLDSENKLTYSKVFCERKKYWSTTAKRNNNYPFLESLRHIFEINQPYYIENI
jgi:hypothetical protein